MSLPGILGGFETRPKQIFHIFGTREKIRNFFFLEKIGIFRKISVFYREISVFIGKNRYLSEKSVIFLRFFYFRFFHPKIFSSTAENRFFAEKSVEKTDFFVHDYHMVLLILGKSWWKDTWAGSFPHLSPLREEER